MNSTTSDASSGGSRELRSPTQKLSLSLEHAEWQQLVNLLTTHKTDWFREADHFDFLVQEFLPRWKRLGKKKLSVWCAASSTGEEPCTVAMVLQHHLGKEYEFDVIGTDIDTDVIQFARNGVYPVSKLDQIPEEYRTEAFATGSGEIAS